MRVIKKTPRSLWADNNNSVEGNSAKNGAKTDARNCARNGSRNGARNGARICRLPALQISNLVWECPAKSLGDGSDLPAGLTALTFGREFNRTLAGLEWPPKLERLTLGSKFNREIIADAAGGGWGRGTCTAGNNKISRIKFSRYNFLRNKLPASLLELTFGKHFNKPLPKTGLPEGLVSLTLGRNFDRSLDGVVWPSGLKVVKLGKAMAHRFREDASGQLDKIAWPGSLERVELDCDGAEVIWIPKKRRR